jgi:Protein of unknown function (DUF3429)
MAHFPTLPSICKELPMPTDAIPRPALLLGWAGVMPFALLAAASILNIHLWSLDPMMALRAYGACILSFMGGVQWGILLQRHEGRAPFWRYLTSVLPALLAVLCLLIPNGPGLIGLMAGFLALLAYDISTVRQGLAPRWYTSLRVQLTLAVVVLLSVAVLA